MVLHTTKVGHLILVLQLLTVERESPLCAQLYRLVKKLPIFWLWLRLIHATLWVSSIWDPLIKRFQMYNRMFGGNFNSICIQNMSKHVECVKNSCISVFLLQVCTQILNFWNPTDFGLCKECWMTHIYNTASLLIAGKCRHFRSFLFPVYNMIGPHSNLELGLHIFPFLLTVTSRHWSEVDHKNIFSGWSWKKLSLHVVVLWHLLMLQLIVFAVLFFCQPREKLKDSFPFVTMQQRASQPELQNKAAASCHAICFCPEEFPLYGTSYLPCPQRGNGVLFSFWFISLFVF